MCVTFLDDLIGQGKLIKARKEKNVLSKEERSRTLF